MHELPESLSHSLRSFRGSIYGNSQRSRTREVEDDLEKGSDVYDKTSEDDDDDTVNRPLRAVVLHPTHSYYALRQKAEADEEARNVLRLPRSAPAPHRIQTAPHTEPSRQDHQPHDTGFKSPPESQHPGASPEKTANGNPQPKRQATFDIPQTPASTKRSLFTGAKIADPDPAADRLDDSNEPLTHSDFLELMGLRAPSARHDPDHAHLPKHLSAPKGLYGTIRGRLGYVNFKYRLFDIFTYFFLILQVFLSAIFIVLGSLTQVDSHIAIAVLGAVSTVVAGALALMKGKGLPNRLRQVRDDLRNVLFEAEELYFDAASGRAVYYRDIRKLREDYLRVVEEARRNHPDTWNRTTTEIAKAINPRVPHQHGLVTHASVGKLSKSVV